MTYISDEGDALFVHEQAQLAYEEQNLDSLDLDQAEEDLHDPETIFLDDEDYEDDDEFVDLSPMYVQDEENVGELSA